MMFLGFGHFFAGSRIATESKGKKEVSWNYILLLNFNNNKKKEGRERNGKM